jgi:hypothetical protein
MVKAASEMETIEAEIYNLGAPAPDSVRIMVFSDSGIPIATGLYSSTQWFTGRNALIDDAAERSRLSVGKIVAEQYDVQGFATVRWTLYYAADGSLVEAYERRGCRAVSAGDLCDALAHRFRLVASP